MKKQPDSLLIQAILSNLTKIKGGTRVASWMLHLWQRAILRRSVIASIEDSYLMQVDSRSLIERDLLLFGCFERDLHGFIVKFLRDGAVFLDVGANVGCYSLQAAALVGANGKVFSFEPSPSVFARLKANAELNDLTNLEVFNVACGALPSNRTLYLDSSASGYSDAVASLYPSDWHGTRNNVHEVKVITLDEWAENENLSRLDLIKIDVEGAEFEVLEGAVGTINAHRPTIAMEVCQHTYTAAGRDPSHLVKFFSDLSYRTSRLEPSGTVVSWNGSGDFGTFTLIASPR